VTKKIENKLKMKAVRKGLKGEHYKAYVYGTLKKVEKKGKKK